MEQQGKVSMGLDKGERQKTAESLSASVSQFWILVPHMLKQEI